MTGAIDNPNSIEFALRCLALSLPVLLYIAAARLKDERTEREKQHSLQQAKTERFRRKSKKKNR